jgi:antirestriction protein ArdC
LLIASRVAGIKTWNQLGRRVRKGETSIRILAPVLKKRVVKDEEGEVKREYLEGFKAAYVFDLCQTEGDELPNPPKTTRVQGELSREQLGHYLTLCPYPVSFAPLQPSHYGYTDGKAIILNETHPPADQLYTLLHEWTHAKYHFDPHNPRSKEGRDLEAECTAYVLCQMLGLEARLSSAEYLLSYELTPAQLMGAFKEIALGVKEIGQVIGV